MLLFVYGTLMRGEPAHGLLRGSAFVDCDQTVPGYRLMDLGEYPGMAAGPTGVVHGEVFEVPGALLPELDAYEGDGYERVAVRLASGRTVETYILREDGSFPAIVSGDWRIR